MNENEKNIETCLAESVLAEVANVPTDAQFRSLVDEALDPLKQQAADQTGSDAYKEVVMYHQPYTFVSSVRQMKSNLILLLRRLWRFPFGRGTSLSAGSSDAASSAAASSLSGAAPLRSLADMWQHYITRLKGNAEYGIPSRLAQLTDLPSAPLLVADRKISGVNSEIPDGVSMGRLLCDGTMAAMVTDIIDDSVAPWTYRKPLTEFSQVRKILLRFNAISLSVALFSNLSKLEELELPEWESGVPNNRGAIISNNPLLRVVRIPKWTGLFGWYDSYAFYNDPALEILDIPSFKNVKNSNAAMIFRGLTALWYCRLGKLEQWAWRGESASQGFFADSANLIHLEIGKDTAISWNVWGWSPTNALDASRTDLIEEGSTAQNNLQQFLSNFRDYIAERLTDNGSGLTLTLSQAVFSSIWDANGNPQVLGDGLDDLRADIHNIVRTTKHWNVNKA